MIPLDFITEWRGAVPWIQDSQVEQDLILSRALVEIFSVFDLIERQYDLRSPELFAPRAELFAPRAELFAPRAELFAPRAELGPGESVILTHIIGEFLNNSSTIP